jgi:sugar lactone lactonase YvrE
LIDALDHTSKARFAAEQQVLPCVIERAVTVAVQLQGRSSKFAGINAARPAHVSTITNTRPSYKIALSILLAVGACTDDDTVVAVTDAGVDASVADAAASDASPLDAGADTQTIDAGRDADAGSVDRGPTTIPFAGDPAGLFWSYGTAAALYVADDANNRVVRWTDATGFGTSWTLPPSASPDGGGGGLGQVVRLIDGTILVTRGGGGTEGTIFLIDATGDAGALGALAPARSRSGLAVLIDGTLVDSYWVTADGGVADSGFSGTVAKLTTNDGGKETVLATGLQRPAGLVFNEADLFVADRGAGGVVRVRLDGGTVPHATIDSPTLVTQGPDGIVFVASANGSVYAVARNGDPSLVATVTGEARGVAYDGAHRRLFVAQHDPAGVANAIRIVPLP